MMYLAGDKVQMRRIYIGAMHDPLHERWTMCHGVRECMERDSPRFGLEDPTISRSNHNQSTRPSQDRVPTQRIRPNRRHIKH